jgi:quercetin dioxygenase-like cupin family protein
LPTIAGSSDKRIDRDPGATAPRVPSTGHQHPRVVFSTPQCRAVILDLRTGESLSDHRVRERAVVQVISGRVSVETATETATCAAGTLLTFEPGERHAVHGLDDARLLLLLTPWPAASDASGEHLPDNATVAPDVSSDPTGDEGDRSTTPSVASGDPLPEAIRGKRILVVVDRTISDARVVRPVVRAILERDVHDVYVVAPILTTRLDWITNDDGDATTDAAGRLTSVLRQLYDHDIDAAGAVGGDEAILTTISDALSGYPADEIIIAIHADHHQHWRERKVADKVRRRHTQPLTEMLVEGDGTATIRSQ